MNPENVRRRSGLLVASVFLVAASALGAGCGGLEIKYQPTTPPAPAYKSNVAIKVVDAREPNKGGDAKVRVGQVRSGIGIPSGIDDRHPDVAPRTVSDATADALRKAGLGVGAGPYTLVATINEYWMDGYMGYACKVKVNYQLVDASGQPKWNAEVNGGSGGTQWGSGNSLARNLFQKALADLATHAGEQFSAASFQQAVGQ